MEEKNAISPDHTIYLDKDQEISFAMIF